MNKLLSLFLAGSLLLASCTKDRINGSGPVSTESRSVSNFTRVTVAGSSKVQIVQGEDFSVQVKGYTNLHPYFETIVSNNTLVTGYRQGSNISNDNIEVYITMPTLEGARIDGSGNMDVRGDFTGNRMDIAINGSGKVDLEKGTTQSLNAIVNGSGNIRAFGLRANDADVLITGSGTTELAILSHLKAEITGSGNIYYKGTPTIESAVSGSGKLVHRP
ncbi:DUF2807 domain-containing protein [Flavisolibacter sp. BT320]|nr:DUF2807 domain-containing protein [Flavisolibacter longurius]